MSSYAEVVKDKLLTVIENLTQNKDLFVKEPDKDFTRKRKISFQTFITLCCQWVGKALRMNS
jgi:hypothetical protein